MGAFLSSIYLHNFYFFFINNLISNLQDYVNEIPENITYSVLPVLRWQIFSGSYRSLSITESIKITRNINLNLLAKKILWDIQKTLRDYRLRDADLELYLMSRPWLSVDEFELGLFVDRLKLEDLLNDEIERKILAYSKNLNATDYTDKFSSMKNYFYKDIIMDKYGHPILDKNNNLLGYQLDENKFISVETSYNKDNLLCNKVSIRYFQELERPLQGDALINWVDVRTEFGFTREFNKIKYFYDNNNIINVESRYSCSPFPLHKKDAKLDSKLGTIDFETFGSNFGMGYQTVYAGG